MNSKSVLQNSRDRERFLKFAVVGAFGALVDFGSFHLIMSLIGLKPEWAQAISFTLAISSNFIWNRLWTYPDSRSKPISNQLVTFFLVNLVGLAIRTPIFTTLDDPFRLLFQQITFLPIGFITIDRLGYTFALGVAVVVVMFWNFFINRVWTYNDVD
ncbi:MAG: GtrA family protein [Chloroflexi bacterium]|nr:GtrA family protein [Chloroflexota bacterium]